MLKEITSKEHPIVRHLMKLRMNRDYRHEMKRVIIEGDKLVRDYMKSRTYHHLYVCSQEALPGMVDNTHVTILSTDLMKKITELPSPPMLLAEVDLPEEQPLNDKGWILALDGIQDPGNVGTIFRTAAAFGWEGIYLLPGCCDPFNEKALRASQGTVFDIPHTHGTVDQFLEFVKNRKVFLADCEGKPAQKCEPSVLVLGAEGRGVQAALMRIFDKVKVPMKENVESLNVGVAAGVLMYTMKGVYGGH